MIEHIDPVFAAAVFGIVAVTYICVEARGRWGNK